MVLAAAFVVAVSALPRVLLARLALPDWLQPFVWSDVIYTWSRGMFGGRVPFWDSYFEYPPLIGYLSGLFSLATSSALAYTVLWSLVQMAAAAFIAAVLVSACGARRTLFRWVLAPQLFLLGPLNWELVVLAPLVVAVTLERAGRPLAASAALAVGTATKLFPAAGLPLVLMRTFDRGRTRLAIVAGTLFVGLVALAYAPAWRAPYSSAESLFRYSAGVQANLDSVWGLLQAGLSGLGVPNADLVIAVVAAIGLAATYFFWVVPAARRAKDPAVGLALALIALLLWTRLYSPQYSLWIVPFYALLPLSKRSFIGLAMADATVYFSIYPLSLVREWSSDVLPTVLLAVLAVGIVLRHVALIATWRELLALARRDATAIRAPSALT